MGQGSAWPAFGYGGGWLWGKGKESSSRPKSLPGPEAVRLREARNKRRTAPQIQKTRNPGLRIPQG